jgi:hypothetical protein
MRWHLEPRSILIFLSEAVAAPVMYLMVKSPITIFGGLLAIIGVVDSVVYLTNVQSTESFYRQARTRAFISASLAAVIILYQTITDTSPLPRKIPLLMVYLSLAIYGTFVVYNKSFSFLNKLKSTYFL